MPDPVETPLDAIAIEHFVFVPIEDATKPIAGIMRCYVDRYWAVDAQNRIAFYNPSRNRRRTMCGYGSPQCNTIESIVSKISGKYSWCTGVQLIPAVFAPAARGDW